MNTLQILKVLEQDRYVKPLLRGVYAIDTLPKCTNGAYVVNTAPSNHPGKHWVAVFVCNSGVDYFDSYGGEPSSRLKRWCKNRSWSYNPVPLQSPLTSVCGQYCIYYLLHRARSITLDEMLLDFCTDVDHNDQFVFNFLEDRFDIHGLKLIDTEGLIQQLCEAKIK